MWFKIKTVKLEVKYKNDKFVAISGRRFSLKVDDESYIENIPGSTVYLKSRDFKNYCNL